MRYLLATDSVHTTAAACDYLEPRVDADDTVSVVTVSGSGTRDGEDALNVANARLLGDTTVETERLEADGSPASSILAAVASNSADIVIIGPHAGVPGAGPTLGSTARQVLEAADVPVVVVPLSL
jgi:nucleotide-binding universal stress UspA family protein